MWLPDGEKFEDIFIRFDRIDERDRRTDGHRTTAYAALIHSITRQKCRICPTIVQTLFLGRREDITTMGWRMGDYVWRTGLAHSVWASTVWCTPQTFRETNTFDRLFKASSPFNGQIKTAEQRIIMQQYGDWYWPMMGALLHLVQRGGAWEGCGLIQSLPRCTKCNSPPTNGQCINCIQYSINSMWSPRAH